MWHVAKHKTWSEKDQCSHEFHFNKRCVLTTVYKILRMYDLKTGKTSLRDNYYASHCVSGIRHFRLARFDKQRQVCWQALDTENNRKTRSVLGKPIKWRFVTRVVVRGCVKQSIELLWDICRGLAKTSRLVPLYLHWRSYSFDIFLQLMMLGNLWSVESYNGLE